MALPQFGTNSAKRRKRVYYEGTNTIYEGMAVCYNYDTTTNVLRYDKGNSTGGTTTAEGYQNEGKFLYVEDPATANLKWFAGVVADCKMVGESGPGWIDIFVPNGAIVPVYSNSDCTIGQCLGISDGSNVFQDDTGDGDPLGVALAEETVDRSGTSGLILAKLTHAGLPIAGSNAYLTPVRSVTTGYAYGMQINGDAVFQGGAASKSYVMQISADRESDYVASGDSNDALLKMSANNYAANDSNYILRGLNCAVNNRSGGTMGHIYGANVSISLKSGSGNVTTAIAMQIDAQDLTTGTKTYFGGLDIALNREGTAGTEEFGLRIRTRGTINSEIDAAIRVDKDATDHGFTNLFTIESDAVNYAACTGDVTVDANDKVIPVDLGGTTYYLIAVDSVPAG